MLKFAVKRVLNECEICYFKYSQIIFLVSICLFPGLFYPFFFKNNPFLLKILKQPIWMVFWDMTALRVWKNIFRCRRIRFFIVCLFSTTFYPFLNHFFSKSGKFRKNWIISRIFETWRSLVHQISSNYSSKVDCHILCIDLSVSCPILPFFLQK